MSTVEHGYDLYRARKMNDEDAKKRVEDHERAQTQAVANACYCTDCNGTRQHIAGWSQ